MAMVTVKGDKEREGVCMYLLCSPVNSKIREVAKFEKLKIREIENSRSWKFEDSKIEI